MKTNSDYYSTSDLNLSSTLVALGFSPDSVERSNRNKVCFLFKPSEPLSKTIESYWNDSLKISPIKLFNAQKLLKNRIYSDF